MSLQPYQNAIYNWVVSQVDSSVTVIWAEQAETRPQRPYLTLRVMSPSIKPGGRDNLRWNETTQKFYLNGPRKMLVDVNCFGKDSIDFLTDLRDSLDDPDVIDSLDEGGLSVEADGNVENLTTLLESHFETRAQLSLVFGFQMERDTNVGLITKVKINDLIIES